MTSLIEIENISVKFGNKVILENITFSVEKGEILLIVGPNGSGKSTLLRTIMGFLTPFRGNISFNGSRASEVLKAGKIGYLSQNSSYDTSFPVDVFDVVAMGRHSKKKFFEKLNENDLNVINESLTKVGMEDFIDHHFGSLSGGQQQRILIARALALQPEILILDEPSTGLDAVAQDDFYQLLKDLRDEIGLTILIVSHDVGTVSTFVDRLACIKKQLHFHGKPELCTDGEFSVGIFGKNTMFVKHDENCQTCRRGDDHE